MTITRAGKFMLAFWAIMITSRIIYMVTDESPNSVPSIVHETVSSMCEAPYGSIVSRCADLDTSTIEDRRNDSPLLVPITSSDGTIYMCYGYDCYTPADVPIFFGHSTIGATTS